MRLRKFLSLFLALVMLVSVVPAAVFAEGTDGASGGEAGNTVDNGEETTVSVPENLFLDKTATLEKDGTYTINLEAYATGTTITKTITEGVPLDVVLVMDQSGSLVSGGDMLTTLKSSVNSFLEELRANGEEYGVNHRVAICGFASYAKQNSSGVAMDKYTFANDTRDNAWINTGIFVNGEFQDYGTVEYIPVNSAGSISTSKYYVIDCITSDEGIPEKAVVYYSGGKWIVSADNEDGYLFAASTAQALFDNFNVYTVGASKNLLTDTDYANSWEYIANDQGDMNEDVTAAVSRLASNGATATFMGMKMARKMLENLPSVSDTIERKKVVIVFTDGQPGFAGYTRGDGDAALAETAKIKASGAEVYTIGIYSDAAEEKVATFMNRLSSNYLSHDFGTDTYSLNPSIGSTSANELLLYSRNIDGSRGGVSPYFCKDANGDYWPVYIYIDPSDGEYYGYTITDDGQGSLGNAAYLLENHVPNPDPDANYYLHASDISNLSGIFETISSDMTGFTSELSLDANAVLKDVLAEGFTLTDNTTVTVSVVPGSMSGEAITWDTAQEVLSFNYPATTENSRTVQVNGAADQTEMTLTAKVEGDTISVTGFNYAKAEDADQINAQYISEGHPGSKLVVTVTGVEAAANITTDTAVATNQGTSGIYEAPDADGDGETGELQASFPVPTTYLTSMVYVVDYAKKMVINPSDFGMTVAAKSLDVDGYNHFNSAVSAVTDKYGKVTVENGKVTYTPIKTNWDGFDTFYVFGTTKHATIKAATANTNGNMWSKVSVIPANNVYYEDTFVTNEDTGTVGIVYTGAWTEDGTSGNQGENAETGESTAVDEDNDVYDQGGVHGWEDTLADDTGYSDGSAHKVSYDKNNSATATFTFTGTGVDIYSRTNNKTGIVIAMLYEGESTTDENGKSLTAKYTLMVDNLAASGDYYQIPTLSLCQIPAKDEDGNTVMTDLPYGTYTVKIIVSKASDSQTDSERFIYYLDGIRVYNPIQNQEGNDIVSGAYGEDELNATFIEIRDKLLDANSFSAEDEESAGPVFIDRVTSEEGDHTDNTKTAKIGEYKVFGPENEVYLSAGQMISFAVEYREGAHYYIGMKSLTGEPAGAKLTNVNDEMVVISIDHTTDLYYEVLPVWEYDEDGNPTIGIIMVGADRDNGYLDVDENDNINGAILALTKLKVTGPSATTFTFARVRNADLLSYAEKISNTDAPEVEIPGVEENPEDSDPTKPSTPDVEIENPESENPKPEIPEKDWQTITQKLMLQMIKRIFGSLSSWFDR